MKLPLPPIPPEMSKEFEQVFSWFQSNVETLETAYSHMEQKFLEVHRELGEKEMALIEATRQNRLIQKNLNALLSSMKPGVLMVDPDFRITVLNPSAEKMLKINSDDIIGCLLEDVFPETTGIGVGLRKALHDPLNMYEDERRVRFKDVEFPATFKSSAVIDLNRDVIGVVETFSDLTALKHLEEEVQQARILGALGEMAATVAHEIRNPLGGIGGYAGLLARDLDQDDPRRKLVNKIIQGVSSLNKIVSNLLFYTRKTQLRLVPVELKNFFSDILDYVEIECQKDDKQIILDKDFPEEELVAEIDPERFQQIVLNLMFNAVQAIKDDGTIRLSMTTHAKHILVHIRDSGIGISSENMKQIFNPFFTTKEQGTGLGLAIVKKIVELHGGEISVISDENGTCFTLKVKRGL
jgi:PAS domain S-box-containing protein